MRRDLLLLALVLLAAGVAGCIGADDDPLDAANATDASADSLPEGISLEGAERVEDEANRTTFRWEGTFEGPRVDFATGADVTTAELRLPAMAPVALEAEAETDDPVDLELEIRDEYRMSRCFVEAEQSACTVDRVHPVGWERIWTVRVIGDDVHDTEASFEATLTVETTDGPSVEPTTPPRLGEIQPVEAKADDGTALRGHVYLPEAEGPHGTVLIYWPYWNHGGGIGSDELAVETGDRETMLAWLGPLLDDGFAVAAVNSRGSGISEGCYAYMDHRFNGPDANAVVDHLANQSWSNGKVGMYGISYGGATQMAALAFDTSEHLEVVIPVSGEWDEWNFLGSWGAGHVGALTHHNFRDRQQGLGMAGFTSDPLTYQPRPEHVCQRTVENERNWTTLATDGDKNEFFQQLDLRDEVDNETVPIMATFGLTDGEGAHKRQFYGMWERLPEDRRMVLGQWPHAFPEQDSVGFTWEQAIPWYDRYLREGEPVETGVVDYQADDGSWHRSSAWPPAEATWQSLYPSGESLVASEEAVQAGEQRFVETGERTARPNDCPGQQATYVSPPLAEDVLLAGTFRLNVTLTSTAPDANIDAYLWHTDGLEPCGQANDQLPDDYEATEIRHAVSDLEHRGHLEQGEPFPVGEPGAMEMIGLPMASHVPAGQRLVLAVDAGHPSYVAPPYEPVLTMHTGPEVTGELALPVVEGELAFETETGGGSQGTVEVIGS